MRKIIIFIGICAFAHSYIHTSVLAASESSLTVAPAILEHVTPVDKVASNSAMITNTTDFPLPIKGQVSSFLGNNSLTKLESSTFNASSWFTLTPADFILQPKESKEVIIHITPPDGAEPGGHYATIYFEPLIPQGVLSPQSTISLARVGVLSFLIVPGDLHENLELESFTAPPFQSFGPITFDLSLRNPGNIHTLPTGSLAITDMFGHVVFTTPLSSQIILPSTTSTELLSWDKRFLFGRFTAQINLKYGSDQNIIQAPPLVFWVIPWPIILIIIALLTLLYKIFIVYIDRVRLAVNVLKGIDVHETQNTSQTPSIIPRSHRRAHSPHSRTKRSHRRQSHKP